MAYQIQRKQQINETLELLAEDGKVAHKISVILDPDSIALGYNKRYKDVVAAEQKLKQIQQGENIPPEYAQEALETLGKAIISILQLIFGDESTGVILKFYSNRYFELVSDIFPFINEVIEPAINKSLNYQREKLAAQYKVKQEKRFGR
jgi:hypothetical protein